MTIWEAMRGRFQSERSFYGCVNEAGEWFDSAYYFSTAITHCARAYAHCDMSPEEELRWFTERGRELGLSIVHSRLLEKLANAGLIT